MWFNSCLFCLFTNILYMKVILKCLQTALSSIILLLWNVFRNRCCFTSLRPRFYVLNIILKKKIYIYIIQITTSVLVSFSPEQTIFPLIKSFSPQTNQQTWLLRRQQWSLRRNMRNKEIQGKSGLQTANIIWHHHSSSTFVKLCIVLNIYLEYIMCYLWNQP